VIPQASLVTPGNYYEFSVTQGTGASTASYIQADKPVMVAQYMISSDGDDCGLTPPGGDGDPEMIYISPIEQGIKKAVFYNTDQSGINSNYINVILPTAGLASLRIDGNSTFTDVFAHPSLAGYSCVRHNLGGAAAQHIIESDSAFNAITYGLGSVESYGYNAGTLVKNLNALPTISNVFGGGSASAYTCEGTPFKLRLRINVKPDTLVWHLSGISQISPNANVTQNFPVPTDSTFINGQWIYTFTLPLNYTFNATGNFIIPITIYHPSIEGCSGSQEISLPVNVIAAPETDFTISAPACVGGTIQFSGTSTSSNGVPTNQWNWTFGDGGNASVQNPTHTYLSAGTYNVNLQAIADDGCLGDTTKQIVINDRPIVALVSDTIITCLNDDATFTVQNPVQGATYNWYDQATGGTLLGTGTSYTITNVTATTSVFVEGIVSGCASVARTQATAMLMPTLAIPVAVVDSIGTNLIRFRWNAIPNATGYEVSINGGSTWITPSSGSTGLTHTVTGLTVGTTITLQVRALGGCDPAVSLPVSGTTVTDQVYIPNAFSPNGDGLNDVFRVYGNFIRDIRFVVFNQWGEKIFESRSQSIMWDGTHKGKPQPSGVYIYVADIILTDGTRLQRKGAINLVR
jgi:gliding motility-associated-like protein